jgi:hypothetical protein
MPVLPAAVRRMWLRRFGKTTRREDWAPSVASVLAARMTGETMLHDEEGLDIPATQEILLIEAGALGSDAAPGTLVRHDGILLELEHGPTPLPSDRAWEYWTVIV